MERAEPCPCAAVKAQGRHPGLGLKTPGAVWSCHPSSDSDTSPRRAIHCARHQFAIITTQSFGSKTTEHYLPLQLVPRKHKARAEQSCKHTAKDSSSSTPHRAGATAATRLDAVRIEPHALPLHHTWGTALGDPHCQGTRSRASIPSLSSTGAMGCLLLCCSAHITARWGCTRSECCAIGTAVCLNQHRDAGTLKTASGASEHSVNTEVVSPEINLSLVSYKSRI